MADPIAQIVDYLQKLTVQGHVEIEIRINLDPRKKGRQSIASVKNLANELINRDKVVESQTINFLNDNYITQLTFIDGKQQLDKKISYTKTKLINDMYFEHCKISVSLEKETEGKALGNSRIKRRYSQNWSNDWRLDITYVKEIAASDVIGLKTNKQLMLEGSRLQAEETASWIEFELEYIHKHTNITYESFRQILSLIRKLEVNSCDDELEQLLFKLGNRFRLRKELKSLKQVSNQVVDLDRNSYSQIDITKYTATQKIDGQRAWVYITNDIMTIITDKLTKVQIDEKKEYLFDAELYDDTLYIFDCLIFDSENITGKSFMQRLDVFKLINRRVSNWHLLAKTFVQLTVNFAKEINAMREEKNLFRTDGIIFTPNEPYFSMIVYKYKPPEKMTVDFLIRKCPDNCRGLLLKVLGKNTTKSTLYLLFCGIKRKMMRNFAIETISCYQDLFGHINNDYVPIQFSPRDMPMAYLFLSGEKLDGKIGEFLIEKSLKLKFIRIREDRELDYKKGIYYGNNFMIAEKTWYSAQNPLVIDDEKNKPYFQIEDNPKQKAVRNFNSFVKTNLIDKYASGFVMDLASGKGQDLFRYTKVKRLLCCDLDKTALQELISRTYGRENINKELFVVNLDLNESYKTNIAFLDERKIPFIKNSCDCIVMNFAIHYMQLRNLFDFVNFYLKEGGKFVFTCFDGDAVQKLIGNAGVWQSGDKFSIIAKEGRKIDVLLPFSKEYYTENLVFDKEVQEIANTKKMVLYEYGSFSNYFSSFADIAAFDNDDKKYAGLYHYFVYEKK